uniref:Uncharacterized protein n=1 Tax=Cacopsylla melanoneura TaxID=428564 RepID=A0A8D8R6H7_9HEMI
MFPPLIVISHNISTTYRSIPIFPPLIVISQYFHHLSFYPNISPLIFLSQHFHRLLFYPNISTGTYSPSLPHHLVTKTRCTHCRVGLVVAEVMQLRRERWYGHNMNILCAWVA